MASNGETLKYYGVIYKITNILNNKIYIGQTKMSNPFRRINRHFKKTKSKDLVYEAYQKYGENNFKSEIIFTAFTADDLNYYEKYFISYYNSLVPNGYNIQLGGDYGNKFSNETRKLMSNKVKEWYSKNNHPFKGKKFSENHKLNMSKSRKGFTSENRINAQLLVAKKMRKRIKATHIETNKEFVFDSIADCSKHLNLDASCIARVAKKRNNRTQHNGWKFEYL